MANNNKTFVKITNKDIYELIQDVKRQLTDFKFNNEKQHEEIIIHQKKTNGKVRLNKWIATTALSLTIAFIIGVIPLILSMIK